MTGLLKRTSRCANDYRCDWHCWSDCSNCLFTQTDQLWLSISLLIPAMFFASFPLVISATALQMLAPNQFRARLSALFLLVSNLIGLGIGTTLVAMITDKIFGNPLMVGSSLSIVGGLSCVLALILLFKGCKFFSESMQLEKLH